jgi:hypothetical protein
MSAPFPFLQHTAFSPASLFVRGEQGVWYDPSDISTLFQDSAGTTPVTEVEQPVGRILDKSGRGNHATQSTSAARPVLSARVNLLLNTSTLATQSVTTVATSYTLRFTGTGTITLSGTATGTYSAGTHTVTCTAGTLTLTVSGTVTDADLRVVNDGINLPVYQRVNTATDYDTAGFPAYLRFDGVDDFLLAHAFSRSGLTGGVLVTGGLAFSGTGAFLDGLDASNANGGQNHEPWTDNNWYCAFGNATRINVTSLAYNTKNILTRTHTSNLTEFRKNGVNVNSQSGTTNFGLNTNDLFIGSNSVNNVFSLSLNGRIYSLVARLAPSSAAEISTLENWVNLKTRAF